MNKFWSALLLLAFIAIAVVEGLPQRFGNWVKSERNLQSFLNQVTLPESLSGPMRGPITGQSSVLTMSGVVDETNKQRELYNKTPLRTNAKLNLAAKAKLDDMFRQQYFEHESPDGKHPADVIKAAGYEYLVVGENLALGNYQNDQILVEAWMNSPGHRANILDGKFDEIGVAVGKGMFEGQEVWLAVQEFGTPLSNCPNPGLNLKTQIENNRLVIDAEEASLATLKKQIESNKFQTKSGYESAVADYNRRADALNKLISQTKDLVNDYNSRVNAFNDCLARSN